MRYDLLSLSLFVAVAEEQNLTRAARKNHLAVSAVSKRIAELEQQIGTALMLRLPRGIELTPAGHSLLFHARQVLRNLEEMEEELSDYAAGIRGHIRISTISAALMQCLPRAVSHYLTHFPQTDIDIEEQTGTGVVQALLEGSADLGIFSSWTPASGIESWPWQKDRLSVLLWRGHRLAKRKTLRLQDCLDEKIIAPHQESAVSHIIERETRRLGGTLNISLRVANFAAIAEMVSHRLGIAIVPVQELAPAAAGAVTVPLEDAWARRDLCVGVKSYAHASPSVKTFIDSLLSGVESGKEEHAIAAAVTTRGKDR